MQRKNILLWVAIWYLGGQCVFAQNMSPLLFFFLPYFICGPLLVAMVAKRLIRVGLFPKAIKKKGMSTIFKTIFFKFVLHFTFFPFLHHSSHFTRDFCSTCFTILITILGYLHQGLLVPGVLLLAHPGSSAQASPLLPLAHCHSQGPSLVDKTGFCSLHL